MHDLIVLFVHLVTTVLRILRPGGLRSVVAESVLIKHQLLIVNRSRRRAPNLRVLDRLIAGFCSLWIKPKRLLRSAVAFKPSTLLNFHRALVQRKYRFTWECSAALPEARCRRLTRPRTWRECERLHRRRARQTARRAGGLGFSTGATRFGLKVRKCFVLDGRLYYCRLPKLAVVNLIGLA